MHWLYLRFPNLLADWLSRDQSRALPLLLLDKDSYRVMQACNKAYQLGVKPQMSLASATSLIGDCHVKVYRPEQQQRVLAYLADLQFQFCDRIALWAPDGLQLEVSGMLQFFGGLEPYYQAITKPLFDSQLQVQVGLANNAAASRLLAKAGVLLLTQDAVHEQQQIAQLPVGLGEFEPDVYKTLARLGVRTFAEILALPRQEVAPRLGKAVMLYLDQLTGKVQQGVHWHQPPLAFEQKLELLADVDNAAMLMFPLKRLLADLQTFLFQRQLQCQRLDLHYQYRELGWQVLEIVAGCGRYQAQDWLAIIQLKLEGIKLEEPVTDIAISAKEFEALACIERDLLDSNQSQLDSPYTLLAKLNAKLGRSKVRSLACVESYIPEQAVMELDAGFHQPNQKKVAMVNAKRPCWLVQPAKPLQDSRVQILTGPERIEAGWWQEHPVCRDYFIAKQADGRVVWLYREPDIGWFIQGYW